MRDTEGGYTLKVAALYAPYNFIIEERALPFLEPEWALVKVMAAGICGSDMHFYTGKLPLHKGAVRGHEIAGVVADPGDTSLPSGESVIINPLVSCGSCQACLRGDNHLCEDLQGIGGQYLGGFAEYVAVPKTNLYPYNSELLSYECAALADCVAVAMHAMNKVSLKAGEEVAIIGDGAIGLLLVQMAQVFQASKILLLGIHESNLKIGLALGATAIATPADYFSVTPSISKFDVVFEAVGGASPPFKEGLTMLRKGGRLGVIGLSDTSKAEVPWLDVVFGEKVLIGIMGYGKQGNSDEMRDAITLMERGAILLDPLISHRLSLYDIDKGFRMMLDKKHSQTIKIVIH